MAFFYLCDCFKDFFYLSSYFCSSFLSTSVIVNILFLFNRFLYFSKKGPATFYGFKSFPNSLFLVGSGRLVSHSDWFVLNPASVLNQPRIEQKRELEAKKKKDGWKFFGLVVAGRGGSSSDSSCSRSNSVLSAGERWEPLQICQVKNLLIFLNIGTRPLFLKLKFHGIALSQGTTCSE